MKRFLGYSEIKNKENIIIFLKITFQYKTAV